MAWVISPCKIDMIVFYQNHIEEPDAVIHSASQSDSFFFSDIAFPA